MKLARRLVCRGGVRSSSWWLQPAVATWLSFDHFRPTEANDPGYTTGLGIVVAAALGIVFLLLPLGGRDADKR